MNILNLRAVESDPRLARSDEAARHTSGRKPTKCASTGKQPLARCVHSPLCPDAFARTHRSKRKESIMAQETNDRTAVGVFEDSREAERAVRDLTTAGIPRESIELKSNFMTGAAGRSNYSEEQHEGGISGFFHRIFGGGDEPSDDTGHYSEALRRGNAVVCVTAPPQQLEEAIKVMNAAGAVDIDRQVERFRRTGYERYNPDAPAYSHDEAIREREQFRTSEEGGSIPVIEEELQVGKRAVRRAGVRVYSRVIEQPVREKVELREERA
jgi:hypothetical protein